MYHRQLKDTFVLVRDLVERLLLDLTPDLLGINELNPRVNKYRKADVGQAAP